MSQNNLLQGHNWDSEQCANSQVLQSLPDEVISVYEVYVKEEETSGLLGRTDSSSISVIPGNTESTGNLSTSASAENQLIQRALLKGGGCMDLNVAVSPEFVDNENENNDDASSIPQLLGNDTLKYKIVEQGGLSVDDGNAAFANQTVSEQQNVNSFTGPRLIDKDDPRSRLHFVKYLKREGKTLKIWECGICTKEFRHQYTLMRHLPTHTDERNFKCDACGKAFRQLSTLSQHKAIHSDARPYVCEFCKKTFNRVSTLISHRKTHSELKPHKCHVCGKGFHQKGNLRNHVFTHTNERPYKCELCGKGFNQMSNLVCHKIKAHAHSEKMQYSCGLCGKEFPRRFALRSHEEYKHGIKYRNPSGIQRERKPAASSQKLTSTSTCMTTIAATTSSGETPAAAAAAPTNGPNVMPKKNLRIVELPGGRERNEALESIGISQTAYTDSLVIDRIETKDLHNAIVEGQTPFALLKPVTGIPVLVKVSPAGPHKHLLTPATADDLQILGKVTLSPSISNDCGLKAMQIKVPVVATITQNVDESGKQSFSIEAPGLDQHQESLVVPLDSHFPFQDSDSSMRLHSGSSGGLCNRLNEEIVIEGNSSLPANRAGSQTKSQSDECTELLELAAQGGIQFVRATEDGRYEVMTNNEARELMAQNSHDVTILDGDDADALNIVNARGADMTNGCCVQEDFMIDHPESQIMVLDSMTNAQKSIDFEAIDIFEDKDIKILDPKNLDDRVIDGMTFLSQMKMDDMIVVPNKSSDSISGCAISIASPSSDDYSGIAALLSGNHGGIGNGQSIGMTSLLSKNQHSSNVSIIGEAMNYVKHCPSRSISEELGILGVEKEATGPAPCADNRRCQQQQPQTQLQEYYSGKIKFNDFENAIDTESANLLTIGHERDDSSYPRLADYYRRNEARNYWDVKRNIPSFGEVKILGAKNETSDDSTDKPPPPPPLQFQDIRILGNYEQYINSGGFGHKAQLVKPNNFGMEESSQTRRKEVKILGKTLECGFFEDNENGTLIKIEENTETCRRMVNDFWEGWIETNRCSTDNGHYSNENNDKESDINYASIIDSQS